ncbi:hypothetical protein BU14_0470s0015 [Porphyra umbilicalis]|uniref:Uncharacterized protein n=1 Tax=Porphyra umbilicalis TaxID=2786 RepID=A0A1X6NUB3_PORUM|nr:hypothetical protein BU14_0470s0015 [Porphyra umbilicalis]|eukprot:OSX72086.1 hypothetical protein BU14_0470s0015 [Porphyra umbilicalis]
MDPGNRRVTTVPRNSRHPTHTSRVGVRGCTAAHLSGPRRPVGELARTPHAGVPHTIKRAHHKPPLQPHNVHDGRACVGSTPTQLQSRLGRAAVTTGHERATQVRRRRCRRRTIIDHPRLLPPPPLIPFPSPPLPPPPPHGVQLLRRRLDLGLALLPLAASRLEHPRPRQQVKEPRLDLGRRPSLPLGFAKRGDGGGHALHGPCNLFLAFRPPALPHVALERGVRHDDPVGHVPLPGAARGERRRPQRRDAAGRDGGATPPASVCVPGGAEGGGEGGAGGGDGGFIDGAPAGGVERRHEPLPPVAHDVGQRGGSEGAGPKKE